MARHTFFQTRPWGLSLSVRFHRTHQRVISWLKSRSIKLSGAGLGWTFPAADAAAPPPQARSHRKLSGHPMPFSRLSEVLAQTAITAVKTWNGRSLTSSGLLLQDYVDTRKQSSLEHRFMNIKCSALRAATRERAREFSQLRTPDAIAPNRVADELMTTVRLTRLLSQGGTVFLTKRQSPFPGKRNALTRARFGSVSLKFGRNGREPERRLWKLKTTDPVYQVLESACYEILALSAAGALLYCTAMFLHPS